MASSNTPSFQERIMVYEQQLNEQLSRITEFRDEWDKKPGGSTLLGVLDAYVAKIGTMFRELSRVVNLGDTEAKRLSEQIDEFDATVKKLKVLDEDLPQNIMDALKGDLDSMLKAAGDLTAAAAKVEKLVTEESIQTFNKNVETQTGATRDLATLTAPLKDSLDGVKKYITELIPGVNSFKNSLSEHTSQLMTNNTNLKELVGQMETLKIGDLDKSLNNAALPELRKALDRNTEDRRTDLDEVTKLVRDNIKKVDVSSQDLKTSLEGIAAIKTALEAVSTAESLNAATTAIDAVNTIALANQKSLEGVAAIQTALEAVSTAESLNAATTAIDAVNTIALANQTTLKGVSTAESLKAATTTIDAINTIALANQKSLEGVAAIQTTLENVVTRAGLKEATSTVTTMLEKVVTPENLTKTIGSVTTLLTEIKTASATSEQIAGLDSSVAAIQENTKDSATGTKLDKAINLLSDVHITLQSAAKASDITNAVTALTAKLETLNSQKDQVDRLTDQVREVAQTSSRSAQTWESSSRDLNTNMERRITAVQERMQPIEQSIVSNETFTSFTNDIKQMLSSFEGHIKTMGEKVDALDKNQRSSAKKASDMQSPVEILTPMTKRIDDLMTVQTSIFEAQSGLVKAHASHNRNFEILNTKMHQMRQDMQEFYNVTATRAEKTVDEAREATMERYDTLWSEVEGRFDEVDEATENIAADTDNLTDTLNDHTKTLGNIGTALTDRNTALVDLKGAIRHHDDSLTKINDDIKDNVKTLSIFESDVGKNFKLVRADIAAVNNPVLFKKPALLPTSSLAPFVRQGPTPFTLQQPASGGPSTLLTASSGFTSQPNASNPIVQTTGTPAATIGQQPAPSGSSTLPTASSGFTSHSNLMNPGVQTIGTPAATTGQQPTSAGFSIPHTTPSGFTSHPNLMNPGIQAIGTPAATTGQQPAPSGSSIPHTTPSGLTAQSVSSLLNSLNFTIPQTTPQQQPFNPSTGTPHTPSRPAQTPLGQLPSGIFSANTPGISVGTAQQSARGVPAARSAASVEASDTVREESTRAVKKARVGPFEHKGLLIRVSDDTSIPYLTESSKGLLGRTHQVSRTANASANFQEATVDLQTLKHRRPAKVLQVWRSNVDGPCQWCLKAFTTKSEELDCFYFVHPEFILLKSQPSVLQPGEASNTSAFGPIDPAMIQTVRVFSSDEDKEPEIIAATV